MTLTSHLRSALIVGASAGVLATFAGAAAAQTTPADAPQATARGGNVVETLVVTAQRREENLQQVPVAVSAFSAETLKAARIDGGQNLLQAVPNVNFTRSNFGSYNLSIRGIGNKVIGNSGEAGVSFHENSSPLTYNRLADAEFYDVDRVEVLRGPQGTLYGRNATGGVVNVITTRPGDKFGGWGTAEYGNYNSVRLKGAVNIPLSDFLAVRWAGFFLKRDGFAKNTFTGNDVDSRDIKSSRLSIRVHPNDVLDVTAMWEHFEEKDSRNRIGKQLCNADPGPTSIGAVPVLGLNRNLLSQGCLPGSRYDASAFGAVNTAATLGGIYLPFIGLAPQGNLLAGKLQDPNLRHIESVVNPTYSARENFFQIDGKIRLPHELTFETLTSFNYDRGSSYQDYNRIIPNLVFTPVGAAAAIFPGGFVNDGQVGRANTLRSFDYYPIKSTEFTTEARIYSNWGGAWDFSLGGLHSAFHIRSDYYVFSNGLTAFATVQDILAGAPGRLPFYIDPGFPPSGAAGHNYYDNGADNYISSNAVFGELYWRPTDSLRVTGGLRFTRDHKESDPDPVTLFAQPTQVAPPPGSGLIPNPVFNGGRGHPLAPVLTLTEKATTGRVNVEWTPHLDFTDSTMLYASYSRGYKAGGFNTPCDVQSPGCGSVPRNFAPEFVDAYEIGTKNTLAGGSVLLNLTAFHYDYSGYQIASIINKSSVNQNVDAKIDGVELESVWEPVHNLRFNLNAGWLHTKLTGGTLLDTLDRTQGNPALAVIKASDGSNCVVNRAALANLVAVQEGLPGAPNVPGVTGAPTALLGACSGLFSAFGLYNYAGMNVTTAPIAVNGAPGPNTIVQVGQGVAVNLHGKKLPNAPEWTVSFGAQYTWDVTDWRVTLRGDYYRQGDSWARVYNSVSDKLKGYQNINATLTLANPGWNFDVQLFVKNLTNETPITDAYVTDDSSGLFANTFTLDPRTYGVAVTKRF